MTRQRTQKTVWKRLAAIGCIATLGCVVAACSPVVVVRGGSQSTPVPAPSVIPAPSSPPAENPAATAQPDASVIAQTPAPAQSPASVSYMVEPVTMPEVYLVTYETIVDEKLHTVTKGQDKDGRIYFASGKNEMLFVPVSNGRYQTWTPDENDVFVVSDDELCTANYVATTTEEFMEYAEQSRKRFNNLDALTGTQEVAGRMCDQYTFDVTVSNFTNQFTLAVDQKTGACLLSKQVTAVGGYVTDASGGFECTAFTTENVQLPVTFQ